MPSVTVDIPASLQKKIDEAAERLDASPSFVITSALSSYLQVPVHTLFQVSTSGALVAGVYNGVIKVADILRRGDFGLGTFANLDGEMIVVDGKAYQMKGDGSVRQADATDEAPFAVVTRFAPMQKVELSHIAGFTDLEARCDRLRKSGNIFYAIRLDGTFDRVRARAVNPPAQGTRLAEASKSQSEFEWTDVTGTLVGIWSPGFSSAFSVSGYHFHFLSQDRKHGGHVLDCSSPSLQLSIEALNDFHLALPETEDYLQADLSKNTADELAYAEKSH